MCKKYKNMGAAPLVLRIRRLKFFLFPVKSTAVYAEGLKYESGTNKIYSKI
jgi:hypothetical protein